MVILPYEMAILPREMRSRLEHRLSSLQNLMSIFSLQILVHDLTSLRRLPSFTARRHGPHVRAATSIVMRALDRENKSYPLSILTSMVLDGTRETGTTFLQLIQYLKVEEAVERLAGDAEMESMWKINVMMAQAKRRLMEYFVTLEEKWVGELKGIVEGLIGVWHEEARYKTDQEGETDRDLEVHELAKLFESLLFDAANGEGSVDSAHDGLESEYQPDSEDELENEDRPGSEEELESEDSLMGEDVDMLDDEDGPPPRKRRRLE